MYCKDNYVSKQRKDIPSSTLGLICIEIEPPDATPHMVLSWFRSPNVSVETIEIIGLYYDLPCVSHIGWEDGSLDWQKEA